MATMNVSLPDQMKDWVEDRIDNAQFANTSDYVRHLIRRDQERQQAIAEMQAEIDKGLESGIAERFDFDKFLARMHAEHGG